MVKVVAGLTGLSFARVQFTPDLLPSDLIGTQIYNPAEHRFETKKGPIFTNLLLADEINRAPAKVQSALLECMAERQVSIGGDSFPLEAPFLVLATQNPIEQEGTYTLPEAQLDRFLFYLKVQYGTIENEMQIVEKAMASKGKDVILKPVMDKQTIHELKQLVYEVQIAQPVRQYIVELVFMSRQAGTRSKNKQLAKWIAVGASPRASIALEQAARLSALMAGRWYVTPQDVKDVAADILRHRIIKSFEAEVEGVTADDVVANLLQEVAIP
jgi:MoxR-like ATPase